jgi:sugar-specific transcriptional regulator TrmB
MKEVLLKAGLTDKEAETYLTLLKLKEANANTLAKYVKVYRTNLYDVIDSLIRKGLVAYVIKNNKRIYLATNPVKLLDYINQKKKDLEDEEQKIKEIIPQLSEMHIPLDKRPIVEVYEGMEGMRTVFNQAIKEYLKNKKEIIAIGSHAEDCKRLDPIYYERHYKERAKYKIKSRYIITEDLKPIKNKLISWRTLPKGYKSPTATYIYGNKVSFWIFLDILTIIVVENEDLNKTYRDYFEFLWKLAKP